MIMFVGCYLNTLGADFAFQNEGEDLRRPAFTRTHITALLPLILHFGVHQREGGEWEVSPGH